VAYKIVWLGVNGGAKGNATPGWEVGRLGVTWDEAVYSTSTENAKTIDLS
jgi:hypothetical protein